MWWTVLLACDDAPLPVMECDLTDVACEDYDPALDATVYTFHTVRGCCQTSATETACWYETAAAVYDCNGVTCREALAEVYRDTCAQ